MSRVLLITRNFPPLWGGMERLNWYMAGELQKALSVRVIGPAGAGAEAPPGIAVKEVPLQPLWHFLSASALQACHLARQWKPDIVLAGSGLTAPVAWLAACLSGARSAVYVHGLDLTVPHPLYRAFWHPLLRRMDIVVANSRATAALAHGIGIEPEHTTIVHPGVDIPTLIPESEVCFRHKHGIAIDAPLLLSVGRLTARKGLRQFVSEVLPTIVAERPDTVLAVVGDTPSGALYAKAQTPQSILETARFAGVERNLLFLGKKFGQDLIDAYRAADIHVFPVRQITNDPEGFGMVAVEAAAHGLPTIAYATGGVIDAVEDGKSGRLIDPGDIEGFAKEVLVLLEKPLPTESCRKFAENFAWQRFGSRLLKTLTSHD